ncbi:MAG TPA: inorganic phosphate transporter [Myxococcales bacterium]|nr:inorganic phosphate transporter [Myxococcales bacterium]
MAIACIVGLYMAWNIGANDVANAMGTSVGSGALTFKKAVIVAVIFEFAGAVLVGGHVTDTVRKGIVDPAAFAGDPMTLIIGMTCALLAAAIWLHLASYMGWPVSTTHSIVGAVTGFGLVAMGTGAIKGGKLLFIVASWISSPLMGGAIAMVTFIIIRKYILDSHSPIAMLKKVGPWLVFPVFVILMLSLFYKGLKNLKLDLPFSSALLYSALVALGATILTWLLMRRLEPKPDAEPRYQLRVVEKNFVYLQILTACFVAFAHGSNDVANAVGPLAAVVGTMQSGSVTSQVALPFWVLLLGAAGIVVGLATYGHKVMKTIGKEITEMTPSRGFSAEFGAAATILLGSKLGLPISTTHTLVGAVIGVGLARGISALDTRVIKKIAYSWIITLPFSAGLCAVLFLIMRALLAGSTMTWG